MQTTPLQRQVKAADLPLERLLANKSIPEYDKLQAASRAFEAVLLRQILESSQKTVIVSQFTKESSSTSVYRDLITNQLAESVAKSGQFGLARSLDQQWQRLQPAAATTAAPAASGTPASAPALRALHSQSPLKAFLHAPDLKTYRHE
jgi:Rod binding domain-containing protein